MSLKYSPQLNAVSIFISSSIDRIFDDCQNGFIVVIASVKQRRRIFEFHNVLVQNIVYSFLIHSFDSFLSAQISHLIFL